MSREKVTRLVRSVVDDFGVERLTQDASGTAIVADRVGGMDPAYFDLSFHVEAVVSQWGSASDSTELELGIQKEVDAGRLRLEEAQWALDTWGLIAGRPGVKPQVSTEAVQPTPEVIEPPAEEPATTSGTSIASFLIPIVVLALIVLLVVVLLTS